VWVVLVKFGFMLTRGVGILTSWTSGLLLLVECMSARSILASLEAKFCDRESEFS
jgi:hypothetical protein